MSTIPESARNSILSIDPCSDIATQVSLMCDTYNAMLYKIFAAYSYTYQDDLYYNVDNHIQFLKDYDVVDHYLTSGDAAAVFIGVATRRCKPNSLETARFLNYEGFIECFCRTALRVHQNHLYCDTNASISTKISSFIDIWAFGNEHKLYMVNSK